MKSKRSKAWHRRKDIERARAIIERGIPEPPRVMSYDDISLTLKEYANHMAARMAATREGILRTILDNAKLANPPTIKFRRWPGSKV